ncbi:fasciclin-like arabinogalactan protein 2 [Lolium rigidum]|uniref:fasciclin-like arabinogalactan protein 2 n=1 Tax=Lolium rigidum TaxID=89674 RepID=UPI001F5D17BE|nr:fasciclin-like arabinogalactan protein 2 [Lolium rigidum]
MAASCLLGLLLIACVVTAGGDDGATLPHLQLPGTLDPSRGHASDAPTPQGQLTDILSRSGCGRFAALVAATPNVSDVFQQRLVEGGGGLTLFCPDDKAIAAFEPTFRALGDSDRVAVLLHHGAAGLYGPVRLAGFAWVGVPTLAVADAVTNEMQTVLVRDCCDRMGLCVSSMWPRAGKATVTKTVSSEEPPLVLYVVDAVLLRDLEKLDGGEEKAAAQGAGGYLGWLQWQYCGNLPGLALWWIGSGVAGSLIGTWMVRRGI